MRAFSAAFFRENDTENGHKEELTYEENKTWISCFEQSKAVVPLLRKEMIISEKYCWYRLKAMKKS